MAFTAKLLKHSKDIQRVGDSIWEGFSVMATNNKSVKLTKKIGTHSGVFHCDEALACFMLKQLPEYKDADIIRTRDPAVLSTCDIVVDVGGEYNPKTHRYDHHQRDFTQNLTHVRPDLAKNKCIKLSSAGLIYAHFGMEVISELLKKRNLHVNSDCIRSVYMHVYDGLLEEIDAIDNGVPMYSEGKPKYRINTHLGARVHRLNPEWNSRDTLPEDELFVKAMSIVGEEFLESVFGAVQVWWPAREIVKKSLENRFSVQDEGEIFMLEERCPWKDHLFSLEEELDIVGQIKFCIFHDNTDSWRVQGIPIQPDSFVCRVFLHKAWRGVRDEKLEEVSGIKGAIFCHSTGFIAGCKTREGALQMALSSLKAAPCDRE